MAAAGRVAADSGRRLLVLTHTNAGVDALRRRLRRFGVADAGSRVSTTDGWALQLVRSFRQLGEWSDHDGLPPWADTHVACARVLDNAHVLDMVGRSYDYVLVDEYQDCSLAQHAIVMAIARVLPVIYLGDPLQAIYGFGNNVLIDWNVDLDGVPIVELPVRAWRWHGRNEDLGRFLLDVRTRLENGEPVDLSASPVQWVADEEDARRGLCYARLGAEGTVVLLQQVDRQCEATARRLGGNFGVMEDLDGSILVNTAHALDGGGVRFAGAVMRLAFRSHANLPSGLKAKGERMEQGVFPPYQAGSAMTTVLDVFKELSERPAAAQLLSTLDQIDNLGGTRFRHEAWLDFRRAALLWEERGSEGSLVDAVRATRDKVRLLGRRTETRVVSRPLLVKGLEYNHACVLSADQLRIRELYVALTRARDSLAVVSQTNVLSPTW